MAGQKRTADTPAGGGRADGRTPRWAADRGGATCLHAMGYGGSPDVEAGEMYQHLLQGIVPVTAACNGRPLPVTADCNVRPFSVTTAC
jgi:hypothetical protein